MTALPHVYDEIRTEFTSKERDAETGLDFFGARYFSSAEVRFTSPDWRSVRAEKASNDALRAYCDEKGWKVAFF